MECNSVSILDEGCARSLRRLQQLLALLTKGDSSDNKLCCLRPYAPVLYVPIKWFLLLLLSGVWQCALCIISIMQSRTGAMNKGWARRRTFRTECNRNGWKVYVRLMHREIEELTGLSSARNNFIVIVAEDRHAIVNELRMFSSEPATTHTSHALSQLFLFVHFVSRRIHFVVKMRTESNKICEPRCGLRRHARGHSYRLFVHCQYNMH